MADWLSAYCVQHWLELAPQGYLMGTEYGHAPGETEPEFLLADDRLREQAIRTTVQLVVGERCALSASSGLINAAPDEPSRCFLATQTLDEARHAEILARRLLDLGVDPGALESVVRELANPNLVKFAEILLEKVDKRDFVAGVVGQNVILEGMAFHVFEMMQAANEKLNPKFAHTLSGAIADERRHIDFGENRIVSLIHEHPEKRSDIQRMQKEMSHYMLATFADAFRDAPSREEFARMRQAVARETGGVPDPSSAWQGSLLDSLKTEEVEQLLADTVLKEFKLRLGRIGIEYESPVRP